MKNIALLIFACIFIAGCQTTGPLPLTNNKGKTAKVARLSQFNEMAADRRTGEKKQMDKDLLTTLQKVCFATSCRQAHAASMYRGEESQRLLRKRNRHAATKSMHTEGKAADIRYTDGNGKRVAQIRMMELCVLAGGKGAGAYAGQTTMHCDTRASFSTWNKGKHKHVVAAIAYVQKNGTPSVTKLRQAYEKAQKGKPLTTSLGSNRFAYAEESLLTQGIPFPGIEPKLPVLEDFMVWESPYCENPFMGKTC